ncbi:MAG: hypothetical protein R3C59_30705 [Planctomycetaceae bacterium]
MIRAQFTRAIAASAMLLATLPLSAQPATATKVLSDQILPQDTYLYVSMPSVTAMVEFFKSSSMGQIWNDPAMDDFKQELSGAFDSKLEEARLKFQENVGLSLDEVLAIPTGEVSLAVSANSSNAMGLVFFLDYGDSEAQLQQLLDRLTQNLDKQPKLTMVNKTFDGTAITMFEIEYSGPAPTPLAKEFGWFLKDQRMVFSNRLELLEGTLENWDGAADRSLQTNEAYAYVMSKCQTRERSSLTTMYFDPIGLFTKLVQTGSLGQQSMGAGMALGFLPALGLNQLKAVGLVSEAGTGDFEAVSRMVVYADQPPTGLMQMFQLDHCLKTPPAWVKEDATAYIAVNWKIQDAYQALESVVDMFTGAGTLASQLDQMAQRGPGIHLKDDVVDQLTGDIQAVTAASDSEELPSDRMVVALGVRDNEAARKLLSKFAGEAGLESREFRGTDLYEINGPAPGQSFSFAVSEGRLLVAVGSTLLEQVLRNDSDVKPLAETDDFRKVSAFFPANAVSVQFSRPAETYRQFYDMLKSGEVAEHFPGNQDWLQRIDFTTLPAFDVIAKYIKPNGAYSVNDDRGLFTEAFQLKD